MEKMNYANLSDLRKNKEAKKGIFQRILGEGGAIDLFKNNLKLDLTKLKGFQVIQEIMLHRHLYAHNCGLIDEIYIEKYLDLTGINLRKDPEISPHYPNEDVYWFRPLKKLDEFIDATKIFLGQLK